jgi:hypothetical protein
LKIFRFEVKLAAVADSVALVDMRRNQFRSPGNAVQARLRFANIVQSDDRAVSSVIVRDDRKTAMTDKPFRFPRSPA